MRGLVRTLVGLAVLAFVLTACTPSAYACPGCKEALAAEDEEDNAGSGRAFSYSVLFMMSMPFLISLGFGTAFYRLHKKQQRLAAQACDGPSGG